MTNLNKDIAICVLIAIFFLFLGWWAKGKWDTPEKEYKYIERVIVKYDTTRMITQMQPYYITKMGTVVFDTLRLTDTIRVTPFTAKDSIINTKGDTTYTEFVFPQNWFKHTFKYSPDTTKRIVITVEKNIDKIVEIKPTFWDKMNYGLWGAAAGAGGVVLYSVIKK